MLLVGTALLRAGASRGLRTGGAVGRLVSVTSSAARNGAEKWKRRVFSAASASSSSGSGSRLAALPVVYHPLYSAPVLAPGHRFPMQVFKRIHDRLLLRGIIQPGQLHAPQQPVPPDEQLLLVHDHDYLAAFSSGGLDDARVRRIGFGADATRSPLLVARTKAEVAGTLLTARLALQHGLAANCAGGTHHAFPSYGSGYCILNDLAVTAEVLLAEGAVRRVLILDLDVHQGDGTAFIFQGRSSQVFTLSVHCESNFPTRKQASTLDIGLPDGTGDADYLSRLAGLLPEVLASFRPDLVLYDAGVDVHVHDALGRLAVTDQGLYRRELLVLDTCLSCGVPVAGYVGGGYDCDLDVLADRHIHLHRAAALMWEQHGLGLGQGLVGLEGQAGGGPGS